MQLQKVDKNYSFFSEIKDMKVGDLMTEEPVSVSLNDDIERAWELFEEWNFRHLPVVNKNGDLQGILSERDIERVPVSFKVKSAMTKEPETASPEMSVFEAAAIMIENKFSCLPVVDGSELVGILSESDFVKLVLAQSEMTDA